MTDFVARQLLENYISVINYLSGVVQSISGADPFLASVELLRLKDSTYTRTTVYVLADANGDPGIFAVGTSASADDGVNVVDSSDGRKWLRQKAPIG